MKSIMQTKRRFNLSLAETAGKKGLLLALCWLLAFTAGAQDNLEKAKLDIWTETAAFVYRDAKLAEPQAIVNAKSLNDFVAAIKADDTKSSIYSKLYQPIEQTGAYRKGPDAKTQLELLIKSINNKLRENNQRMADLGRRQRLNDLYKQLQQIASDYTSPAAVAGAVDSANQGDESFTAPDRTAVQIDSTAEEPYADNQLSSVAKKQGATRKPDMVSILALVLGLLNLGLMYFLYKGINKVNQRLDQRKKELEALSLQVNGGGVKGAEGNNKLTLSAIESMVQKTIAKELGQRPQHSPRPVVPAPAAAPLTQAVTVAVPVSEEQHPAPAAPVPDVPVVDTPAPAETAPVAPPAPAPNPEKPVSFFARVPVNGGFHEQDLYPNPQHDSIYEIRVSKKDPNKAAFRIVTNTAVHRSAIESAYLSLKDACNYQMNNQHATRIVTDEPGTLTFQNGFWLIDRKAQVHFE
jgi:hypothetical protein